MSEKINLRAYNLLGIKDPTLEQYSTKNIFAKALEGTGIDATRLNEAFIAIWVEYDIVIKYIEDQQLGFCRAFKGYMLEVINEYKNYYDEMITAYSKQYDYTEGLIKTIDNESIYVDLPNKVVNATDIYKYPSSGDKGKSTITNKDRFIALKLQYMSQIRDLYREFAYKFKDLFYHTYEWEEEDDE